MAATPEFPDATVAPGVRGWRATLRRWFDSGHGELAAGEPQAIDWGRIIPYLLLHLSCVAVLWVGWSWTAVITAAVLYWLRMFAITGFYHRYFSHRSFKTSRVGQFLFGVLGASAVQRGPVWWAAHHRHHHAHSDQPGDVHSPVQRGFLMSHTGWFLTGAGFRPDLSRVKDLLRYPELRWLDRYDIAVPALLAAGLFGAGVFLEYRHPELGTDGWQMLVWGFSISTVVCYHATYTINSLSHVFGRRRYDTGDASRNNFWLALLTLGEGWHNNHHFYPSAARQGFYWWEIDLTWYGLKLLSWTGLIWDLKPVPVAIRDHSPRRLDR